LSLNAKGNRKRGCTIRSKRGKFEKFKSMSKRGPMRKGCRKGGTLTGRCRPRMTVLPTMSGGERPMDLSTALCATMKENSNTPRFLSHWSGGCKRRRGRVKSRCRAQWDLYARAKGRKECIRPATNGGKTRKLFVLPTEGEARKERKKKKVKRLLVQGQIALRRRKRRQSTERLS